MAFELSFVDSIAASPTTRLDINSASISTLIEGTEFGLPSLSRAYADTLMTDGAFVPAAAYGNRVITLNLDFNGVSSDTAASRWQSVIRELDRPFNFLRFKPDTTNPVFFRTMRSDASSWYFDAVTAEATVKILAEPFAYGTKQTLSLVTVNADPAAGSNGCFFDVTGVLGDVETPLYATVGTSIVTSGGRTSAIGVRRRGTPANVPFLTQAESLSLGTDTTLPGNDTAMSGSGSNYARCSFATSASLQARVSTTFSSTTRGVDIRGTYRTYVRVRKSVGSDSIQVRMRAGGDAGVTLTGDTVTCQATSNIQWVDLGLLTLPLNSDPVYDGPSGVEIEAWRGTLSIDAGRASGSGNLDIDCILLVPADDRFALVTWPSSSGATDLVMDGGRTMVYARGSAGEIRTNSVVPIVGGLPMVSPSATNRVFWVRDVGTANTDTISGTTTVTPYYWPRYLAVRPLAS